MRKISIGGSLVVRQILFLILLLALSAVAIATVQHVRDAVRPLSVGGSGGAGLAAAIRQACDRALLVLYTGAAVGCLLVAAVSAPLTRRTISRPIQILARQIRNLAQGEIADPIEGAERNDEIGELARSLVTLQDAVRRNDELMRQLKLVSLERDAWRERKSGRRSRVEQFGEGLERSTKQLNEMTHHLREAAEQMMEASRIAHKSSTYAKEASDSTSSDVNSVSRAAEQMASCNEQINSQVLNASALVKTAADEARASSEGMTRLSAASRRIGDVAKLISDIAAQTNLLALNATIEAARAGELGRGFAIVAQEVKTLATQTARATQDISTEIREIQTATQLSVETINSVRSKIIEMEGVSAVIAAAIREQDYSTRQIAKSVEAAASSTVNTSTHVDQVEAAIGRTNVAAETVQQLAYDCERMGVEMRSEVVAFAGALEQTSANILLKGKSVDHVARKAPGRDEHGVAA